MSNTKNAGTLGDPVQVAVDIVLLTVIDDALWTLLVRRPITPFRGRWALPGVFVGAREDLAEAAGRALRDKSGLEGVFIEQLFTFGAPRRDPRGRVISVAYFALVDGRQLERTVSVGGLMARLRVGERGEASDAVEVLDTEANVLALAFDHDRIIGLAVMRLRGKLAYTPVGYELLPKQFTLLQLQRIHETILGHAVNKDSFRRRMLASGELVATGERQRAVGHRPAALYRFTPVPAES